MRGPMPEGGAYRGIRTNTLHRPDYLALSAPARLVRLTLRIQLGPHGIAPVSGLIGVLAEQTGLESAAVTDALRELEHAASIRREGVIVWDVEGFGEEPSRSLANDNHRREA